MPDQTSEDEKRLRKFGEHVRQIFDVQAPETKESAQAQYEILSPDGFPITREPFSNRKEALEATAKWCEQYTQQGYYSTADRQKIPLDELPDYLSVVPVEGPEKRPITEKSLETIRQTVREDWEREFKAEREDAHEPEPAKDKDYEPPEPDR